jgi:uncharacterized Zn-binding protein involved in type VI secretion
MSNTGDSGGKPGGSDEPLRSQEPRRGSDKPRGSSNARQGPSDEPPSANQPARPAFVEQADQPLAKPQTPPDQPVKPVPPPDVKKAIAAGLQKANAAAQAFNAAASTASSYANMAADPGAAIAGAAGAAADEKMGQLVSGLAAAIGPFPAATLTGMALGIPHAHVKHPPSGPPPIPPIPLPPLGPVLLGTNLTVLINSKPTARCGDYGINPTCAGILPPLSALYQIITGSSSVYIGGCRAARSGIDITMHCFNMPSPKISVNLGKLAGIASKVGKAAAAAGKVAGAVGKVAAVAGTVAQATAIASSFADAEANDDGAMAAAIGLSVAMMAAQMAADAAATALTKTMGTDQPAIPPVGTPGMILNGSPNVMLGGFPLPSFAAMAQGLLKRVKGIKATGGGGGGGAGFEGPPT